MKVLARLLLSVALAGIGALAPAPAQAPPTVPLPATGAWPLQPAHRVVDGFDPPDAPWGAGHRGVDLAGHAGEAVHASRGGTVSFAGTIAGVGIVVVTHGETRTTYQPVSPSVRAGHRVARDQVIGHLRLAGSHCLPAACLHWGLIESTRYLDPLMLVGGGRVRLLPLG